MWGKINELVRSKVVLTVLLLSGFFISVVTVLGILVLGLMPVVSLAIFTLGQLLLSGAILWLMRKLEVFDTNDFKLKGIGKGFLFAWFGFVYIAISFLVNFMSVSDNGFVAPNVLYLIVVCLHPFIGTGLFEEVLYRGLVLKLLLKKTGSTKKGIIAACVGSSAIFGLFHIVNVLAGAPVLSTVAQIISAFAAGLFFAAVFVRTGKLWIPIIFHGLLNLSSQIFNAIVSFDTSVPNISAQAEPDILGFILGTLFETLPILIAALVLLRKVEPGKIFGKKAVEAGQ